MNYYLYISCFKNDKYINNNIDYITYLKIYPKEIISLIFNEMIFPFI